MPAVPISELVELQRNTPNIRNICIVAHVDHGKTTLADSLISSNGIFSARNAGKIRYMDFTKEEQERGITMKSASISLLHRLPGGSFLVNLMDSPGHVDFTQEVGSALRATDGCVVVVDAVEGVCIQTRVVLRQAWNERVRPVLFVNKMDKLITKLNLDEEAAYEHIKKLLTSVNEITSVLWAEDFMNKQTAQAQATPEDPELDLHEDDGEYFSPSKGNVVFGSALGGWGFRTHDFVGIYAEKLGVKADVLQRTLWGDFYYVPKTKTITKKKPTGKAWSMFSTFVLKPIWTIYNAAWAKDLPQLQKIMKSLNLEIPNRELNLEVNSPGAVSAAVLSRWHPLAQAVLSMVVEKLPSPVEAQSTRIPVLWKPQVFSAGNLGKDHDSPVEGGDERTVSEVLSDLTKGMQSCNKDDKDLVVFVSKVFAVPNDQLMTRPGDTIKLDREGTSFIALARIFSGTIKVGQRVWVLGPKYNPLKPTKHIAAFTVTRLYLLMGRSLEALPEVPAGNVFGIGGVEGHILKTATLASHPFCASFDQMVKYAAPIVRVAVEAENTAEIGKLREGMKCLNIADPGCEVWVQKTGEFIVAASGELHLKRCLTDLELLYAKTKIKVSPPILSFKETVAKELSRELVVVAEEEEEERGKRKNEEEGEEGGRKGKKKGEMDVVVTSTRDGSCTMRVVAKPLPKNITLWLEDNKSRLETFFRAKKSTTQDKFFETLRDDLKAEFEKAGKKWIRKFNQIWSFGPHHSGPNILFNSIPDFNDTDHWVSCLSLTPASPLPDTLDTDLLKRIQFIKALENSFITGFGLVVESGPLCQEPVMGVYFDVVGLDIDFSIDREATAQLYGPLNGQVMASMKKSCSKAFKRRSPRLVEPLYECFVQVYGSDNLGKVHGVLSKRRSKVLKEDIKEGSQIFEITALMPAAESFGFADELFTKTSGAAHGQLVFSKWEVLDQDPDFIPISNEEIEESGYNVATLGNNIARTYIDQVRKRKGLPIKEKIVKNPNQQRTRSKKK